MYILATWRPRYNIWIIGCQIGLLCVKSDSMEIYLAVSRSRRLTPRKYLVGLKQNYLFYAQRDVYGFSTGPQDLTQETFLPDSCGFFVRAGKPIYIKVGAVNLTGTNASSIDPEGREMVYDAFCNLYYVLATREESLKMDEF